MMTFWRVESRQVPISRLSARCGVSSLMPLIATFSLLWGWAVLSF